MADLVGALTGLFVGLPLGIGLGMGLVAWWLGKNGLNLNLCAKFSSLLPIKSPRLSP